MAAKRKQSRRSANAAAAAEQRWGKAMQHPLRPRILRYLLEHSSASAMGLSKAWAIPVGILSAHLRYLRDLDLVTLDRRAASRGAFGYHYRLSDRADVQLWIWRTEALPAGVFGGPHAGQAIAILDEQALEALRPAVDRFLAELAQLGAQTHERQLADPGRDRAIRLAVLVARDRSS
jgi:DNA-binding transcriptional ArsR family regulator